MVTYHLRRLRLWILVTYLLAGCNGSEPKLPFDPHIQGFELVNFIQGNDALDAINRLHGKPINALRGYLAQYEGDQGKATIWVSEAPSEELAIRQIIVMIEKMAKNRKSPFRHYRSLQIKNFEVTAFNGLGKVHHVFRKDKWVYWISTDGGSIDRIFNHVAEAK